VSIYILLECRLCQYSASIIVRSKRNQPTIANEALWFCNVGPLREKRFEPSILQKVVAIDERLVASRRVVLRQFKLALLLATFAKPISARGFSGLNDSDCW
jgi:hypothetical protein